MSQDIIDVLAQEVFDEIKGDSYGEESFDEVLMEAVEKVLAEKGAEDVEVEIGVYEDPIDYDKGYADVEVSFVLDGAVFEGKFRVEFEKSYYFDGEPVDPENGDGIDYVMESLFDVSCLECECDWERYSDDHIGISASCKETSGGEQGGAVWTSYSGEVWLDVYVEPTKAYKV